MSWDRKRSAQRFLEDKNPLGRPFFLLSWPFSLSFLLPRKFTAPANLRQITPPLFLAIFRKHNAPISKLDDGAMIDILITS